MGFEIQIRKILKEALDDNPSKSSIQVLMFSATFPKEIKSFAETYLGNYVYVSIGGGKIGSVNKCIKQEVVDVRGANKSQVLYDFIKNQDGKLLVFCATKKCVHNVFTYLSAKNLFVTQIHGDKSQDERERELDLFKTKCGIMIATDVASRGLDIPNVTFVVNYDLPSNIEDYIHRIGRTGRVGRMGTSISFVDVNDYPVLPKLHQLLTESGQQIPKWFNELNESVFDDKQSRFNDKYRTGGFNRRGGKPPFSRGGPKPLGRSNITTNNNYYEDDDDDYFDDYDFQYSN